MSERIPELPPALKEKRFALENKVGGGGFSTVYKASWTKLPDKVIAAKVIKLAKVNHIWVLKNLKNEMKIIKKLNHKNIIRVYDVMKTSTFAFIFMEFASNGSVYDILEKTEIPILEPKAKKYVKDVVNGLNYCHSEGVAHRDIKPDNFLIDQKEKVLFK